MLGMRMLWDDFGSSKNVEIILFHKYKNKISSVPARQAKLLIYILQEIAEHGDFLTFSRGSLFHHNIHNEIGFLF